MKNKKRNGKRTEVRVGMDKEKLKEMSTSELIIRMRLNRQFAMEVTQVKKELEEKRAVE